MIKIYRYQREDGFEPFTNWLNLLKDKRAASRIRIRILQIEAGNLGDWKPITRDLIELRIHMSPGYRVYCGGDKKSMVILFTGGTKSTQKQDIKIATNLWNEWKARQS